MSAIAQPALENPRSRSWSDWAGFFFFIAFTIFILKRTPAFGILLLPGLAQELFTAVSFLLRRQARQRATNWKARASAYGATFIIPLFTAAASEWRPVWLAAGHLRLFNSVGFLVWFGGSLLVLWGLWRLRLSFSIEPQARDLVTTGPYRIARHPIYLAYVLQYGGMWLAHPSLPFALSLLAWLSLALWRIGYEEEVLLAAFPAYARYRREVGRFGPKIFSRRGERRGPRLVVAPPERPSWLAEAASGDTAWPRGAAPAIARPTATAKVRRAQQGQSLVEFALILPMFCLLIFGFADMGRLFFVEMDLQNAVRQAGRYASTGNHLADPNNPGQNLSRVQSIINTATAAAAGVQVTGIQINSLNGGANNAGGPGDTVTISIASTLTLMTPIVAHFFTNGQYNFTVSVSFKNEPFPPANTL